MKPTPEIKRFCNTHNITIKQFLGQEEIIRSLNLSSLTQIPPGFNPTVGGSLYLPSLTQIPENFNPTVGGNIDLSSLTQIPEDFNPTAGGYLDLSSLTQIPPGFNPTVGGALYLPNHLQASIKPLTNNAIFWGEKYLKADGIFTEILHKKGNIYRVKKLNSDKEFYAVTDNNGNWAHGDTLREATQDLDFKIKSDKDLEEYKILSLDHIFTKDQAVTAYRLITGSCKFGVNQFLQAQELLKDNYSVKEIIELTEDQYGGNKFKNFFNKR